MVLVCDLEVEGVPRALGSTLAPTPLYPGVFATPLVITFERNRILTFGLRCYLRPDLCYHWCALCATESAFLEREVVLQKPAHLHNPALYANILLWTV